MLLEKVLLPSQEVLQHSQLQCMQQVRFWEVTDNAVKMLENIQTLVDPLTSKTYICCWGIQITELSVQGVILTLTKFDWKFAHIFGWAFAPVTNAILDVVKVSGFWVVSDQGVRRCNTTPEVFIGISCVEYAAFRIHLWSENMT